MTTIGTALARALRARMITTTYGTGLAGLDVVPVAGTGVAALFAAAHGRVHATSAAVVHGRVLDLGQARGAVPDDDRDGDDPVVVTDEATLIAALDGGATRVHLDLDLEQPSSGAPYPPAPAVDRWVEPDDELVALVLGAERPVLLVGPGLVRAGAVPGLHALAAVAHLGVLNTWGAKGVFDWRSRHHLATAGLQRDDYALGGLADADLILTCGLDLDEAPTAHWRLAPTADIPPGALDPLSARWLRDATTIEVPPLRAGLADVTQRGWTVDGGPMPPSRVTRTYAQRFGTGGLLAADAGAAGFWVARTYATTELGAVQVPGARRPGLAAACAAVARRTDPHRLVLAVVDAEPGDGGTAGAGRTAGAGGTAGGGAVDDATARVLEAARSLGIAVPVEVWAADGPALDAVAHDRRLEALAAADAPAPVVLGTDPAQRREIEAVAGPVVAWTG